MDKFRAVTFVQKRLLNPLVRTAFERGLRVPGYALLETTGRRSGQPRRTPVGDGLDGSTFWIVSEHGRRSAYVRNIEANPTVRVLARGRWRSGTAHPMPDDDPLARQRMLSERRDHGLGNRLGNRLGHRLGHRLNTRINAASVRRFGTDLLTVRIDLDD